MGGKINFFAIVFKVSAKFCLHPVIAVNERKKYVILNRKKTLRFFSNLHSPKTELEYIYERIEGLNQMAIIAPFDLT